ncbi:MAG: low specificity L-threonine aldolase [Clostridiales bacterium]|nr:low specificity L-threonine aldolase [Clostridiales bacterium]
MHYNYRKSFASDNNSIVHPKVMEALERVNSGHYLSYGEDPITSKVEERFREIFGPSSETFFVFSGTAANLTGLSALMKPYNAVICPDSAHIKVDECGAVERFSGSSLLTVKTADGKLRPHMLDPYLGHIGVEHSPQPSVISITQSTELGTVYTIEELKALCSYAHSKGLLVHMDGARLANAAASLDCSLRAMTTDVGVDLLSFGGSKNGLMVGEAVVFTRGDLAEGFKYIRKQAGQLASKMRYIAAQFDALLTDDLWLKNAKQANKLASLLAEELKKIPGIRITRPVEANALFVNMPAEAASRLMETYPFYLMNKETGEYRWMTSFDMVDQDIYDFVKAIKGSLSYKG